MNINKTTSAGKWSVALAIVPAGIAFVLALLFGLPILTGQAHGEAAWGPMVALYGILHFGSHILAVTSLLGITIGFFAVCKSKWKKGMTGVLMNLSFLILAGLYLTVFYHKQSVNPNRLPLAASQGDYKTVEKLVSKGFDINYQSSYGERGTALSNASGRGYGQIVKFLLSHGADVNIGDPLSRAARTGKMEIAEMLLENGANPNCLYEAVRGRHTEMIKLLLKHKADINHKNKNGYTPLHDIVTSSEEMVKLLISNGADVNAITKRGETPLHILVACWPQPDWPANYRENMIDILLDAGADIEAKTRDGRTPLYAAAGSAKPAETVQILLNHGADPENIKDVHIKFIAAPNSMSETELENWVRSNASDVNVKDDKGQSLLHSAVKGKNKDLVVILLEMGADIDTQDNDGNSPVHLAVKDPDIEVLQMFIANNANLNIQNKKGETPLHILTKGRARIDEKFPYQSQIMACELLLTNGADVDIKDRYDKSPLEWQRCLLPQTSNGLQYQKELIQLMQKYENKQVMGN